MPNAIPTQESDSALLNPRRKLAEGQYGATRATSAGKKVKPLTNQSNRYGLNFTTICLMSSMSLLWVLFVQKAPQLAAQQDRTQSIQGTERQSKQTRSVTPTKVQIDGAA